MRVYEASDEFEIGIIVGHSYKFLQIKGYYVCNIISNSPLNKMYRSICRAGRKDLEKQAEDTLFITLN